jgi:peptide/nickel transport system substrate-binding protein
MRRTRRFVAIILAILGAAVGVGLGIHSGSWAAGERDVTIAQGIDAEFLDVQMTNNIVTLIINGSIYDTLLTRDKQLQIAPALATSYKLVSDKVWEAKLRQGVKFHNGEPFDANAVKFSFERINRADFKSPQKGWFGTIERVEVVDPYTVRFHTKVPDPAMPARMTLMYQVPPKYVSQVGDAQANLKPVGTGPFKFVEWTKNERIVVEANDAHWSGKPAVRRATWRPIPELGSRIAALQTGQADLIVNVPPDQIQALQANKSIRIEKTPSCPTSTTPRRRRSCWLKRASRTSR